MRVFPNQDELTSHLQVPQDQICDVLAVTPPIDPEDGISAEVFQALSYGTIETWNGLWRLLFHGDDDIPSPGEYQIVSPLARTAS